MVVLTEGNGKQALPKRASGGHLSKTNSLPGVSSVVPTHHPRLASGVLVRRSQVLAVTSSAPLRVLGTVEEVSFLPIESLDGAGPVAAVSALYRFAGMLRVDGLKLRVRVIVWWTRHVVVMMGEFVWLSCCKGVRNGRDGNHDRLRVLNVMFAGVRKYRSIMQEK